MIILARKKMVRDTMEAKLRVFDGSDFIVTRRRWLHILDRHKELRRMLDAVKSTASEPDEVFVNPRGNLHLIKKLKEAETDFLVLICRKSDSETYLITAYLTGASRKERRYRKFRKLAPY